MILLCSCVHLQVQMHIEQVASDSLMDSALADYEEDDEEDLSDTDPEDEWEW